MFILYYSTFWLENVAFLDSVMDFSKEWQYCYLSRSRIGGVTVDLCITIFIVLQDLNHSEDSIYYQLGVIPEQKGPSGRGGPVWP